LLEFRCLLSLLLVFRFDAKSITTLAKFFSGHLELRDQGERHRPPGSLSFLDKNGGHFQGGKSNFELTIHDTFRSNKNIRDSPAMRSRSLFHQGDHIFPVHRKHGETLGSKGKESIVPISGPNTKSVHNFQRGNWTESNTFP